MSDFDSNPFADPFADQAVASATRNPGQGSLEDYNPFANQGQSSSTPAVVEPTNNPPPYTPSPVTTSDPKPTPQQLATPGQEDLLRRQEELERKAEELAKREQQLNSGNFGDRKNNWPPLPQCCPVGPCFFQDFTLDIPPQSQWTVKAVYYSWMFYVLVSLLNVIAWSAFMALSSDYGTGLGLSILWFILNPVFSLCWYRPVYNAFKSDSSFWFFVFFFIMFAQVVASVVFAIGITSSGYAGWLVALDVLRRKNTGVAILGFIVAGLFTFNAVLGIYLLKKSGASFEKAQQEFASGVVTNPGVQQAAAGAASAAIGRR